ncbi:MAG: aminoacyl-tRNA hydrolase [Patescibacteria group bacterium]
MFYIVGLGNPGDKYANTRHNVGWQALDLALQAWNLPSLIEEKSSSGRTTEGKVGEEYVQVLYPDTYMNNSGSAVIKMVPKGEVSKLIVVHDDIDLPLGQVKVGKGRGAGGNNGIKSIIEKLGSKDFVRIRIGIAPKSFWTGEQQRPAGGGALERFVLKPFGMLERGKLPEVYETARLAIEEVLKNGPEAAMNKYN